MVGSTPRGLRGALAGATLPVLLAVAACGGAGRPTAGPATAPSGPAPAAGTTGVGGVPPVGAGAPGASQAPPAPAPTIGGSAAGAGVAPAHPVPVAFRISPGAPSDAEVRRELAQLARLRRQALSAAPASAATLLPWDQEAKVGQVSVASVFTDYGLGLACGGVLGRDQIGVAHKTAPCGTMIVFRYAGRQLRVPVIDRGPYIAGREWDLTGAAAAALGFPGLGQIQWSVSP